MSNKLDSDIFVLDSEAQTISTETDKEGHNGHKVCAQSCEEVLLTQQYNEELERIFLALSKEEVEKILAQLRKVNS